RRGPPRDSPSWLLVPSNRPGPIVVDDLLASLQDRRAGAADLRQLRAFRQLEVQHDAVAPHDGTVYVRLVQASLQHAPAGAAPATGGDVRAPLARPRHRQHLLKHGAVRNLRALLL